MRDNSGKIILALLAGASAGVVAGLLMAPDSGEATRTGVKKWASKLSKDLEKNLQAGLDEIKNMSSDVMDNLNKKAASVTGNGGATSGATTGTASNTTGAGTASSSTGATGGGTAAGPRTGAGA